MPINNVGRPARMGISAESIIQRLGDSGQAVACIVAAAKQFKITRVSTSTVRTALKDQKAALPTIKAIVLAMSKPTLDFVRDDRFTQELADAILRDVEQLTSHPRRRLTADKVLLGRNTPLLQPQDVKNLIKDKTISQRLIKRNNLPSLYEAITHSKMYHPDADARKDRPDVEGFEYNHFLQIGAVALVIHPESKVPVAAGYNRVPGGSVKGTYLHTSGVSILWATGFIFGLAVTRDMEITDWVATAYHEPEKAADAFMGRDNPVLLQLLSHKLNLYGCSRTIRPLGIVTNDQRKGRSPRPRIYTQYLFEVRITLKDKRPLERCLRSIVQEPDQVQPVLLEPGAERQFFDLKGEPNRMDIAAWKLLLGAKVDHPDAAGHTAGFTLR